MLEEFGKVWMASSPFTQNFAGIRHAIDCGVDTIVLKSTSSYWRWPWSKKGERTVAKGVLRIIGDIRVSAIAFDKQGEPMLDENNQPLPGKSLFCTSTKPDIELLTVQEANRLYDQIKDYAPCIKVVQSIAPIKQNHFKLVDRLKADAFEFVSRFYASRARRPYVLWSSEEISGERVNTERYLKERSDKIEAFRQGLASLNTDKPVLFKVARQDYELDFVEQLAFEVDGFTCADSRKIGALQNLNGVDVERWGKGSQCGEILRADTMLLVHAAKRCRPECYVSASGGIMDGKDALMAFHYGADSVQLCSAVYFDGWKGVEEIVKTVKSSR